jgi:hypothetical protein
MAIDGAHLTGAVKSYIRRMLAEVGVGMKALLLDASTVRRGASADTAALLTHLRL